MLRAIAADPDDDAVRLVYADWLSERGDPRGELIQLELALAAMDDFDERKKATTARIAELSEAHAAAWLAPFARLNLRGVRFTLDRGVVGGVAGTAKTLAAAGAAIVRGAPLVSSVAIEIGDRDLAPLAGSPLLAKIRELQLHHFTPVRPTHWETLAVPEVRAITLSSVAAGPDDLGALFAQTPGLRALVLSGCRLNKGAIEGLARGSFALRRVELPAHELGSRLGELLGPHPLEILRIAGNPIGAAGLAALRPALRNLTILDLRGCDLASADVATLFEPGVLGPVVELYLGGAPLDDALIARLVAWPGATRLRRLNLGSARLSDRAARILADAPSLAGLRSLVMSGSSFSLATKAALVASTHLANARIFAGTHMLGRKPAKPPAAKRR